MDIHPLRNHLGEINFSVSDIDEFRHTKFFPKYMLLLNDLIEGLRDELEMVGTHELSVFVRGKLHQMRVIRDLPERILDSIEGRKE